MNNLNEAHDLFLAAKKRVEDINSRLYVQKRYLQLHDSANIWLFHTREEISNNIDELTKDRNFWIGKMINANQLINSALINLI